MNDSSGPWGIWLLAAVASFAVLELRGLISDRHSTLTAEVHHLVLSSPSFRWWSFAVWCFGVVSITLHIWWPSKGV